MERIDTRARRDAYGSKLNREHSDILAYATPYVSIALASFLPVLPIATALPFFPPFGFLMLLAWRMVRPGFLPVAAGFPLGLVDDLFSGQPFGSAILLWSLAMIAIEVLETQFRWRNFHLDWISAAALTVLYVVFAALFSGAKLQAEGLSALAPQIILSLLAYPILARAVASGADIFLLDEPFAGLDPSSSADLVRRLQAWAKAGRLVVTVVHDLDLARRYFPQALLVRASLIAAGSTAEVLNERNLMPTTSGQRLGRGAAVAALTSSSRAA